MRPFSTLGLMIGCAALAGCANEDAEPGRTSETLLARELAGRSPGEPQNCVPIMSGRSLRPADAQTLLYGHGDTLWVNRLSGPCPGLRPQDALIIEPTGSQYCRGDRIRSLDPVSRIPGPVCILGEFVPYRR